MEAETAPVVRHLPDRSRYELIADEQVVGIADYRLVGNEAVFTHTEIAGHLRGRGLGEALVRGAMDDVRAQGWTVVPQCWFVLEFLDANPEYADLPRRLSPTDLTGRQLRSGP